MESPILEQDWKYMRSINDEILNELCTRILRISEEIIQAGPEMPHQRYLKLFRHIKDSDELIARCFDDWRRSTIKIKILSLRHAGLLTDSHIANFSDSAREWLKRVEED